MIGRHEQQYGRYLQKERLRPLDMTSEQLNRLAKNLEERARRESAIPESDVEAAVDLFLERPELGALKAHLTLVNHEAAFIGSTFLNEIKQQMGEEVAQAAERRRVEGLLAQELIQAQRKRAEQFVGLPARYPHEVWATDFIEIEFLSRRLYVCIVYDVYSQAYLSLRAGEAPGGAVAVAALEAACESSGRRPDRCLLSDNGGAYRSYSYAEAIEQLAVAHRFLPPHSPWFNGSLESNNRGLRTTIMTVGIQHLAEDPGRLKLLRGDVGAAVEQLQSYCDSALEVLNRDIARPKFRVTPRQVLDGQVGERRTRQEAFVENKKRERQERMDRLRQGESRSRDKTLAEKVSSILRRKLEALGAEELFASNELLHGRYRLFAA